MERNNNNNDPKNKVKVVVTPDKFTEEYLASRKANQSDNIKKSMKIINKYGFRSANEGF